MRPTSWTPPAFRALRPEVEGLKQQVATLARRKVAAAATAAASASAALAPVAPAAVQGGPTYYIVAGPGSVAPAEAAPAEAAPAALP